MPEPRDPRFGTDPQHTQPIPPVTDRAAAGPWSPPGARPVSDAWRGGADPASDPERGTAAPAGAGGGRRRYSGASLVTGMVLAALIGAGAAVGTDSVLDDGTVAPVAGAPESRSIIVNDQEDVNAVTAAALKASPSVVTISAAGRSQAGSGSGVILDEEGHILTNTHVVTLDGTASNPYIEVRLNDGTVHPATVVGTDPLSDLAVLKIEAEGLVPAKLGSLDDTNVGDTAIAIGAPLGLAGTVTDGIVSTLDRTIEVASSAAPPAPSEGADQGGGNNFFFDFPDEDGSGANPSQGASTSVYLNVLQTDAAINPGNSGGPLINTDGEVIGINVAIASAGSAASAGNIGVGFAIPMVLAQRVAQEIIEEGSASHGYLGTSVSAAAAADGRSQAFSNGAVVREVAPGSPADEAGLRVEDIVTEFNGHRIEDASSLTAAVRELPAGGSTTMSFVRGGEERTVEVTVGDLSAQ